MQTPQGLDAKHGDELFLVQRQYTGINSGARRAPFGGPKILALTVAAVSPTENTQRATMQTPQGLDAKHSDELFPVQRQYTGINSGARRASMTVQKFWPQRQPKTPTRR
jgi:hypothetical protein